MPIKFGTDGWRAKMTDDFTFDNVAICANAVAQFILQNHGSQSLVLVGYDTRSNSLAYAQLVAEILTRSNLSTLVSSEPVPTPALSYNILSKSASGGVVITASHNPPDWNGFKYKPHYGGSASPSIIAEIESTILNRQNPQIDTDHEVNKINPDSLPYFSPKKDYFSHIETIVDLNAIKRSGINVLVDCMYGAGQNYLPEFLVGSAGRTDSIRSTIDPSFPGLLQPEPISENLGPLSEAVIKNQYDVGIAYDGDADRLGIIDETGRYIDTLKVFALLALYMLEIRQQQGAMIKSITSSNMLFKLGSLYGSPVYETPVGFKYIGPKMIETNALIGGEESGGYGFINHIPERDGILSSLYFLSLMNAKQMSPSQLVGYLESIVGPHYYGRRDIKINSNAVAKVQDWINPRKVIARIGDQRTLGSDFIDGRRLHLKTGWVTVRLSGTEPLIRIYAESYGDDMIESILNDTVSSINI